MYPNGMSPERAPYDDVTVRWAEPRDRDAIRRVAERDSSAAPSGPTLVAEVGGRVMAARPIDGGETVADPFHPTRDLVDLLELRTAQITAHGQEKGRGMAALWLVRHLLARSRNGSTPEAAHAGTAVHPDKAAAQPGLAGR